MGCGASSAAGVRVGQFKVYSEPHRDFICLFCRGKLCPHENYRVQYKGLPAAIPGLNSSWVTDEIIAMQRPSSWLMRQHHIAQFYVENNIGAIFNLQMIGEHALCGDGIHDSGFSYLAEEFTDYGIYYYNPSWVDMTVPSCETLLDIVQMMEFHIRGTRTRKPQKVSVHCHAGLGRTGLAIAGYLVYADLGEAYGSVHHVRKRRGGAIQTSAQELFIKEFKEFLVRLSLVFPSDLNARERFALENKATGRRKTDQYKSGVKGSNGGLCCGQGDDVVVHPEDEKSSTEDDEYVYHLEEEALSILREDQCIYGGRPWPKISWTALPPLDEGECNVRKGCDGCERCEGVLKTQGRYLHGEERLVLKDLPRALFKLTWTLVAQSSALRSPAELVAASSLSVSNSPSVSLSRDKSRRSRSDLCVYQRIMSPSFHFMAVENDEISSAEGTITVQGELIETLAMHCNQRQYIRSLHHSVTNDAKRWVNCKANGCVLPPFDFLDREKLIKTVFGFLIGTNIALICGFHRQEVAAADREGLGLDQGGGGRNGNENDNDSGGGFRFNWTYEDESVVDDLKRIINEGNWEYLEAGGRKVSGHERGKAADARPGAKNDSVASVPVPPKLESPEVDSRFVAQLLLDYLEMQQMPMLPAFSTPVCEHARLAAEQIQEGGYLAYQSWLHATRIQLNNPKFLPDAISRRDTPGLVSALEHVVRMEEIGRQLFQEVLANVPLHMFPSLCQVSRMMHMFTADVDDLDASTLGGENSGSDEKKRKQKGVGSVRSAGSLPTTLTQLVLFRVVCALVHAPPCLSLRSVRTEAYGYGSDKARLAKMDEDLMQSMQELDKKLEKIQGHAQRHEKRIVTTMFESNLEIPSFVLSSSSSSSSASSASSVPSAPSAFLPPVLPFTHYSQAAVLIRWMQIWGYIMSEVRFPAILNEIKLRKELLKTQLNNHRCFHKDSGRGLMSLSSVSSADETTVRSWTLQETLDAERTGLRAFHPVDGGTCKECGKVQAEATSGELELLYNEDKVVLKTHNEKDLTLPSLFGGASSP